MKTRRKPLTVLQKAAKGRDCTVRIPIPGFLHDPEKSVLAHLNTGGMGQKALDIDGAICCSECHDVLDRRKRTEYSLDDLKIMHYEAVFKTQKIWLKEGLVMYKGQPDMSKMVFYGLN